VCLYEIPLFEVIYRRNIFQHQGCSFWYNNFCFWFDFCLFKVRLFCIDSFGRHLTLLPFQDSFSTLLYSNHCYNDLDIPNCIELYYDNLFQQHLRIERTAQGFLYNIHFLLLFLRDSAMSIVRIGCQLNWELKDDTTDLQSHRYLISLHLHFLTSSYICSSCLDLTEQHNFEYRDG